MPVGGKVIQAECVWPLAAELGEGPLWLAAEQAVWFVDIKGERLHRFDTVSRSTRTWDAPDQPGFNLPIAGGGFVCGLKSGLHRFDPETGLFTLLDAVMPRDARTRLNDGHVDRDGRLWFGTMDDGEAAPVGALYRRDSQGSVICDKPYVIPNGPATSPDGRTLYHVDTLQRAIYAFDMDAEGALSNKRLLTMVQRGFPDGPVVDSEGCIWVGLWGGYGVNRYDPTGRLIDFLPLPTANVTKVAFGGAGLKTLYITTAWKGLSAAKRAAQPLSGGLFAVTVGVPGLPQEEIRHGR
jgi:xylono-1,5-lactonase